MSVPPSTPALERSHVSRDPDVCGGKPCVVGSRIRVQDVYVWHERQGQSPDEIVRRFPQLTLGDVYGALAYFWDHRDEILSDMAEQDMVVTAARARFPSKLPGRRGAGDGG